MRAVRSPMTTLCGTAAPPAGPPAQGHEMRDVRLPLPPCAAAGGPAGWPCRHCTALHCTALHCTGQCSAPAEPCGGPPPAADQGGKGSLTSLIS